MQKGTTNNPNGRPKGVPNRVTGAVREVLARIIAAEIEQVPQLLRHLPSKERLDAIIKLLPYAVPRVELVASPSDSAEESPRPPEEQA